MKIERLKLVNSRESENIIFSCEKQFLPAELQSEPIATQCTVFYYPERDALVLNEGNPNYSRYKELLVEYLNFNNFEKKELHAYMDSENIPSSFFHS